MDKPFAIFDMDGTLVDSMGYWKSLAAEYLQSKGVRDISPSLLERIKPMTMSESAALFIVEYGLSGTAETVAAEMNALMEAHYRRDIPLKIGVGEYLEKLAARGVTMCVASATAEELMEACLERLGVKRHFAFLLSCEEVGCGKERSDVYLEAARRMHARPENCAVYEDASYALATAAAAGFYTVAVRDESNKDHWLSLSANADESIEHW